MRIPTALDFARPDWYGRTEGDICSPEEIIARLREIADLIEHEERPHLFVSEAYSVQSAPQGDTGITLILRLRFFHVATGLISQSQPENEEKYEYTAGEVNERPTAIAFARLIGEEREPVAMRRKDVVPKLREIADLIEHKIARLTDVKHYPWGLMQAHSFQSAKLSARSTTVLILRFVDL
jgi:hypothetical protein